jgi:hypothetical protein
VFVHRHLAVLVVASLTIAGCSSSSENGSGKDNGQSQTNAAKPAPKPKNGTLAALISCVRSSGHDVERRDGNLIAITGNAGQGMVNVERMPSHAKATAAAKTADLIESKVVGRLWLKYFTTDEGLHDDVETCALTGTPE